MASWLKRYRLRLATAAISLLALAAAVAPVLVIPPRGDPIDRHTVEGEIGDLNRSLGGLASCIASSFTVDSFSGRRGALEAARDSGLCRRIVEDKVRIEHLPPGCSCPDAWPPTESFNLSELAERESMPKNLCGKTIYGSTGKNLSDTAFACSDILSASFTGPLTGSDFTCAMLNDVAFGPPPSPDRALPMTRTDFSLSDLTAVRFADVDAGGIDLSCSRLHPGNDTRPTFSNVVLDGARLRGSVLSDVTLHAVSLDGLVIQLSALDARLEELDEATISCIDDSCWFHVLVPLSRFYPGRDGLTLEHRPDFRLVTSFDRFTQSVAALAQLESALKADGRSNPAEVIQYRIDRYLEEWHRASRRFFEPARWAHAVWNGWLFGFGLTPWRPVAFLAYLFAVSVLWWWIQLLLQRHLCNDWDRYPFRRRRADRPSEPGTPAVGSKWRLLCDAIVLNVYMFAKVYPKVEMYLRDSTSEMVHPTGLYLRVAIATSAGFAIYLAAATATWVSYS